MEFGRYKFIRQLQKQKNIILKTEKKYVKNCASILKSLEERVNVCWDVIYPMLTILNVSYL